MRSVFLPEPLAQGLSTHRTKRRTAEGNRPETKLRQRPVDDGARRFGGVAAPPDVRTHVPADFDAVHEGRGLEHDVADDVVPGSRYESYDDRYDDRHEAA